MRNIIHIPSPRSWWSVAVVLAVAVAMALASCSPKKNTAATRNYQAFITRYNVYFNGDEHYKETLKEMETAYEDDYTGPLLLHPAEAYGVPTAPQPSGSFTRSIEKAQKAIQLHSIKKRPKRKAGKGNDPEYKKWLKREEYNPFLHNAWMLMGRSQYLGGDFLGAASTFYYVSKHFTWLPATVTEARLWEARCYCALDWLYEAEVIITRIKDDQLTSKKLRELYAFTSADFYVRSHDYDKAIPMLREAARLASKAQKPRLYFILGRVCAEAGRNGEAYEAYKKAGSGSVSYRARFNARIKQSEVYDGADIEPEVKALRRMTRYGSNREYLDQIYYAIGNLYLSRRDTANAIANYELAAEHSTRNGIDKAISQVTLGGLYYAQGRYDKAQPCYAEGVPMLPETYPGYAAMKRRSDVLDELAVYSQNVVLNDSLLRLAAMPEAERLKVIDNILAELKKKEKEEAENAAREEYLAQQEAAGSNLNNSGVSAPQEFTLNTDKSWYFYNTATRNAGRTDFQRRWGSRKLEDDWRRRNKASFSLTSDEEGEDTDSAEEADGTDNPDDAAPTDSTAVSRAADPHYPEYYLRQIPVTDAQKVTANDVIQEGLYNSGLILKDRMEDFAAAQKEWDRLMSRYPENVYRLDVYHNEYLMHMRQGREDLAEPYRQRIIAEFPDSKYGVAMKDPAYLSKLRGMEQEQESLYERAYDDYLADRNGAVHSVYARMERDYPLSPLMPKFMFLHALAYVTENKPTEFNEVLRSLLERYPEADIAPLAAAWHKGINEGRQLHSSGSNTRSMLWDIRLTNDSTALAGDGGELEFTLAPDEPHYLVLLFSTDALSPNRLLYEVARHNFSTYVVKDFDLEVMNFGPLGLLIIKGFDNQAELNHYRSLLARDGTFTMPAEVRPVEISKSNFDRLLQGGGSFDDYFRFIGEETIRDTHESVLPPEEYPSAGEMFSSESKEFIESKESNSAESDSLEADYLESKELRELKESSSAEPDSLDSVMPTPVKVLPDSVTHSHPDSVAPASGKGVQAQKPVNAAPAKPKTTPGQPANQTPKKETPKKETPVTIPDYPIGSEGEEDD